MNAIETLVTPASPTLYRGRLYPSVDLDACNSDSLRSRKSPAAAASSHPRGITVTPMIQETAARAPNPSSSISSAIGLQSATLNPFMTLIKATEYDLSSVPTSPHFPRPSLLAMSQPTPTSDCIMEEGESLSARDLHHSACLVSPLPMSKNPLVSSTELPPATTSSTRAFDHSHRFSMASSPSRRSSSRVKPLVLGLGLTVFSPRQPLTPSPSESVGYSSAPVMALLSPVIEEHGRHASKERMERVVERELTLAKLERRAPMPPPDFPPPLPPTSQRGPPALPLRSYTVPRSSSISPTRRTIPHGTSLRDRRRRAPPVAPLVLVHTSPKRTSPRHRRSRSRPPTALPQSSGTLWASQASFLIMDSPILGDIGSSTAEHPPTAGLASGLDEAASLWGRPQCLSKPSPARRADRVRSFIEFSPDVDGCNSITLPPSPSPVSVRYSADPGVDAERKRSVTPRQRKDGQMASPSSDESLATLVDDF